MSIFAFGLDVQIAFCRIGERFEEVRENFCRHVANHFRFAQYIPYEPTPPRKIEGHQCKGIVLRENEVLSLDAALVADGFEEGRAEGQRGVVDGVIFIHMKVAVDMNQEIER